MLGWLRWLEREEREMSKKREPKKENLKLSNALEEVKKLTPKEEKGITPTEQLSLLVNESDATFENHIVKLEPTQTYILRDFLRTNNILNQSMNVLNEQNRLKVMDYEKQADPLKKHELLQEAAHETRNNAHALAAMVQAKVAFIKAIKMK